MTTPMGLLSSISWLMHCFSHRRPCSPKSRFTVTAMADGSCPLSVDGSPTSFNVLADRLRRAFSPTDRISPLQWPSTPWSKTSAHFPAEELRARPGWRGLTRWLRPRVTGNKRIKRRSKTKKADDE